MDFFAAQDRARARTRALVVYFIGGVGGLVVLLNVLALMIFHASVTQPEAAEGGWQVAVWVTVATLCIVGGACAFKVIQLSDGGGAVARSLGAAPVLAQTNDPDERRLRNVVEEMALASGLPVPEIYVIEQSSINAFAAGLRPEDAAVVVTRGALRDLSRDELQGVMGHEFSHILNGDMRLNLQLIGAVFGLFVLTVLGREMMAAVRHIRGGGRDKGAAVAFCLVTGLVLMLVGWLGVIFGRLMQAAVSRQREQLADAAAVQFTRNPAGLAGALKKIGATGSHIDDPHAQETAHLFFAPALDVFFATHPPIEERIRALEPHWDGKFITVEKPPVEPPPPVLRTPSAIAPNALLAPAGVIAAVALADVHDWHDTLVSSIQGALADPAGCRALALAIALSENPAERMEQLRQLRAQGESTAGLVEELAADAAEVPAGRRLPLLELAFAGLAALPEPQKNALLARLRELSKFDRQPDWHNFALWRVAECRLRPRPPRIGPKNPDAYRNEMSVLLSSLAAISTSNDTDAALVFQHGLEALPEFAGKITLTPRAGLSMESLQSACLRLEGAPFSFKKQLLEACAQVVQADGLIAPEEAEMLRALAASFGCPLPPG